MMVRGGWGAAHLELLVAGLGLLARLAGIVLLADHVRQHLRPARRAPDQHAGFASHAGLANWVGAPG